LDDYEIIPFKVLNYLGAEINYGGRVTDDKDVRLIKSILKRYINPGIVNAGYKFSKSGLYYSVEANSQEDYLAYIRELPLNPNPEVFGLHENAEITNNQSMTIQILGSIISIQPKSSSAGGKSRDQIITEISQDLAGKTPLPFDLEMVTQKFPTEYTESMNTVLT
jgi:dynein heavy chain, axonemal